MTRFRNIFFNITLSLNCLLLFLLLFEQYIQLPLWLQVTGRLHPMLLHFPIVLVVLYVAASILSGRGQENYAPDLLLLFASFTSAITALSGLFLSREEGYDPEALTWHKWSGVGISVLTLIWYSLRNPLKTNRFAGYTVSLVAIICIVLTGHQGAGLTHGQNFLFAPIMPEENERMVSIEEAIVFKDLVRPILEEKCLSCHNKKKAKGELMMETDAMLLKGGKNGKLWDSTEADYGLMLRRIHLPLEHRKRMPPQGKPQLTDEEISLITRWIRRGADFDLRLINLDPADTLRMVGETFLNAAEMAEYEFEAADPELVNDLNSVNRIVAPTMLNSPALTVSFFNSSLFNSQQLKELLKIKRQIVSLDLSKMPVTDADLKIIAEFENLRKLNLSFTSITGNNLNELSKLIFLRTLTLSGTKVQASALRQLADFPGLRNVYAWKIPVDTSEIKRIDENARNLTFETGYNGDTAMLKLTPPSLENDTTIITKAVALQLKHFMPGSVIRYTTDGTEPDSVNSPIYSTLKVNPGQMTKSEMTIKARAFKPGWLGSAPMVVTFYKTAFKPDTIHVLSPTDTFYTQKTNILYDQDKGTTNFRAGNWLAWRRKKMDIIMQFDTAVLVNSITLSSMIDLYRFIFPPVSIEIWGGESQNKLSLLYREVPKQPEKMKKDSLLKAPSYLKSYECIIKPTKLKYIRIVAPTVTKLPAWHTSKGDVGYFFVDEILVN